MALIGYQAMEILERVHDKFIVHRDLKPDNLMLKDQELYLIDFGLAKRYVKSDGSHVRDTSGKLFRGTYTFSSVHTHSGGEYSRRCDLESLGYVLVFLIKGKLPWGHLVKSKEILNLKRFTSVE